MCAPDRWRTSLCGLPCALQIDGEQIDWEPVCVTCVVRSRLIGNQFDIGSTILENQFVSPVMCAPDRWRTSLCRLRCALQIDGEQIDREQVCVTWAVRSRLMENHFDMRSRFLENQFGVRSRLMENHFDVGCRMLENQFVSPAMCAPDRWRTSLCGLRCALQIDGEQIDREQVCVTWAVRSRLMENQFDMRSRFMENQFGVRSRLMENHFDVGCR
ncbi:hypothetical protein RRG08_057235 [Elysia crispata]|uniref:Uncharacterized protein n=1 Tax=Elysia crispata TaxID=231223 RepID=A0AAE1DLI0_9GAST|nr:hypothetical protein RRG08_057235 [Elysia crispata]